MTKNSYIENRKEKIVLSLYHHNFTNEVCKCSQSWPEEEVIPFSIDKFMECVWESEKRSNEPQKIQIYRTIKKFKNFLNSIARGLLI